MGNETEKRHKRGRPRNSEVGLPVREYRFTMRTTKESKEELEKLSKRFHMTKSNVVDMLLKYADVAVENGAFDQ